MAKTSTRDIGHKAAGYEHPLYVRDADRWRKLRDVRLGTGGFRDGTYLIAHPREWIDYESATPSQPTKKLKARRALATYENFAATIVQSFKAGLFREAPVRRVGDSKKSTTTPLQDWWTDVDASGTPVDDFQQLAWDGSATFGLVYQYLDRMPSDADTAADVGQPYIRLYTPLDVPDWVEDEHGELVMVKFLEAVTRTSLTEPVPSIQTQVRVVDQEKWTLFDHKGKFVSEGEHGMGVCPVVRMYAMRQPLEPGVGASLLGDPQQYIDLYNLRSELRELLRNQTFSILNIPLGTGPDALTVQAVKEMNGAVKGTEDVLFSGTAAGFISADAANVEAYQTEIDRCLRQIYRTVALQWESDTKDAEAEGSLKLKREDMNQRLAQLGDELEKADQAIARLWYRATYGAEDGQRKYDEDQVTIIYPQTFNETPFEELIEQATASQSLGMPSVFLKEQRKRLVTRFLPDAPPELIKKINDEIDAMPDDLSPDDKMRLKVEGALGAVKGEKPGFGKQAAA
jgi:hypothetical protein